ncbi:alpha/beta hydrolase [Candidatus Nomurabacteria bacterium]|nr:alpha/beta hydrolase [Candidatus Nomurabacteria bacterium]
MERVFNLKTKDNKKIYCFHNTGTKKNKAVAVAVHGLTGSPNERSLYNAAHNFPKKGIDVFRSAFYWWSDKKHRKLSECSLATHANDLNTVLRYLRPKYQNITVIGHSIGSIVILKADKSLFDNVILWEPSYLEKGIKQELSKI